MAQQLSMAIALVDMMKNKTKAPPPQPKKMESPAAFDPALLAKLAQQAAAAAKEAESQQPPQPPPVNPLMPSLGAPLIAPLGAPPAPAVDPATQCVMCGYFFMEESVYCKGCGVKRKTAPKANVPAVPPVGLLAKAAPGDAPSMSQSSKLPPLPESAPPPEPSAAIRSAPGSGKIIEKSEYLLAKGPDGKRVWIHKVTGEIRTTLPTNEGGASGSSSAQDSGQPGDGADKAEKVKNIVGNVVGALTAAAGQHQRSAAVAPTGPKAPAPPKAPMPSRSAGVPDGGGIYLPDQQPIHYSAYLATSAAPANTIQHSIASQERAIVPAAPAPARSRSRSGKKDRRAGRSGSRGRRSRSRGRRASPRPPRRRRSRSRSRSRSRKRLRGFSDGPQNMQDGSLLPTGMGGSTRKSNFGDASTAVPMQSTRAMLGRKVFRMPDAYIRSILGRKGETIQRIISKTGSSIKVEHTPGDPEGTVEIANNIDRAVAMIRETLEGRGCPWNIEELQDQYGSVTRVTWKSQVVKDDIFIPTELVGLLIGNNGDEIQKIKNQLGGALTVKILPPVLPGGFQEVQVVGDNWKPAKELVRERVQSIMKTTSGRWHTPGFSIEGAIAAAAEAERAAGNAGTQASV